VAFAITDITKDIYETDRIISDYVERKSSYETFEGIAEEINSDADYLCGLEYGFEDFKDAGLQTENFRLGVEDGKSIRSLAEPYPSSIWD
jgi:CDP-glycerol glycerophosphotransferase (TagB/SpsB family)